MQEHLSVALNPLIELVVCHDGIVKVNFVRHNEGRLGSSRDDQVTQVAVVRLDVALTCTEGETLLEELAEA